MKEPHEPRSEEGVVMPAPTPWPMVLAVGLSALVAGLVTHWFVAALGLVIAAFGALGWGRVVHAPEGEIWAPWVPPGRRPAPIREAATAIEPMGPRAVGHRMLLPAAIHPYSSGAWGGIIAGLVMAAVALGYGVSSGHGVWYPVNLLAGAVVFQLQSASVSDLEAFHLGLFVLGVAIHLSLSLGVGVLYGVVLPMLPGHAVVWGGIIAPLLWTGAVYEGFSVINPLLASYASWPWFVASQIAYGLVAGAVVERSVLVTASAVGRPPRDPKSEDPSGRTAKRPGP